MSTINGLRMWSSWFPTKNLNFWNFDIFNLDLQNITSFDSAELNKKSFQICTKKNYQGFYQLSWLPVLFNVRPKILWCSSRIFFCIFRLIFGNNRRFMKVCELLCSEAFLMEIHNSLGKSDYTFSVTLYIIGNPV